MIFKYALITPDGEIISRHKNLEKATLAAKYCKTCVPTIIKIEEVSK